ncbi:hypothetical protein AXK58_15065 [Tsukamurella tyrosinosolvens]|jgi:hypothetical protein|uniref:Uncharacterized protein n=2 Tax=Tsukamurella tyrosinosolvens TaxID=57704 RepID=A0A1H4TJS0_TSUTY|nr:hypothetical protein ASU32_11775 [Tsukamurella tyrosinosolvens]KXO93761.1 hypothetical protein AXK58_15065 [Tsukamurella tyrosinosolvens]KXP06359.1 hypothetical protein AXK59_11250 [Tsukamurella tyrosinosolvens]KZL96159.1 hypothetical protein AXX05_22340 [Tsukamurella tyrosinosolvens]SEC56695.1 hypothetical protein SAMN04489793_2616 [Tsukamurella tyrosinosolvens]
MPDPVLVSIGDIHCTRTEIITPVGSFPVMGSQWTVTNHSVTTRAIPTWAIVMAIVGAFAVCVFSLFFLLAKEDRTQGFVQVTVVGPEGRSFTTSVPVYSPSAVQDVYQRVDYARNLAIGM